MAIFPLDLVLLPSTPLPLHIFEDRYKEMIAECLETRHAFGLVRAKEDRSVEEIGCSAEIVEVSKQYPDGRMNIMTQGRQRFEIMRVDQERAFLRAEVAYIPDEPGRARPEDVMQALKLQAEILELAEAEVDGSGFVENPHLSFQIAGSLPLDLDFKQNLLSMNSESERMQTVVAYLKTILPSLRRTLHVRKKAGGNGHGI